MEVGWGTVWLRGWEVGNEQCVGVGWFWAPRQKWSCQGSVSANKTRGVLYFGPDDGNEVGYTMVEGLGGGWRAGVGWFWAPRQKPSRWGLVLANEMWGVTQMHQGGFCEVAECGVEVVG